MVENDLGQATIVYESADGKTEQTVDNEHVAYFQDHWIIKTGEDEEGNDTIRRIPHTRVYHVERNVEEFEDEMETLKDRVQSFTDDLRNRLMGDEERRDDDPVHVDIKDKDENDS
ncbi:hypothetical protein ACFQH3_10030 [Haladaptatus sp. GCM10025707]|uniref:hypothetical protein n=1 Tax=unclassified Haladaptatus TaxID=2622732 RepID=UPI0023E7582B|nr:MULTISPECIES: hypothetical protein [unclassified Haladaptatus]